MTEFTAFIEVFKILPRGHSLGHYQGRKYSLTVKYGHNDRSAWLYAEELGGNNHISFNLYFLKDNKMRLKPCEMSADKVIDFVMGIKIETLN